MKSDFVKYFVEKRKRMWVSYYDILIAGKDKSCDIMISTLLVRTKIVHCILYIVCIYDICKHVVYFTLDQLPISDCSYSRYGSFFSSLEI